jgi:hypothetical protein
MDFLNLENLKNFSIFVSGISGLLVIIDKLSNRRRLVLKIEKAKLIEDYPGEIGMQINGSLKAYNGSFFLKDIEVKNSNLKVNETSEINFEIREYLSNDTIKEYLESEALRTTIKEREDKKKNQFIYDTEVELKQREITTETDGWGNINVTPPDISSIFEQFLTTYLIDNIHKNGRCIYKEKVNIHSEIRDRKVDAHTIFSFTLFVHVYGYLNRDTYMRKSLPLNGWKIIINHMEGKINQTISTQTIPYSEVNKIIDNPK